MRIYISYLPIRRGLTGREYLAGHLDEFFTEVKFHGVVSNKLIEFGYLEGETEQLADVISSCAGAWSIKRLFLNEFRGACRMYFVEREESESMEKFTITDLYSQHNIESVTGYLDDVRAYKLSMLKGLMKSQFNDSNDLIANLIKQLMLLTEYKDELNEEQVKRYDIAIGKVKQVYDIETCLKALEDDISVLEGIMPGYYGKKEEIKKATSKKSILEVSIL
jgi:hypothetical protein